MNFPRHVLQGLDRGVMVIRFRLKGRGLDIRSIDRTRRALGLLKLTVIRGLKN